MMYMFDHEEIKDCNNCSLEELISYSPCVCALDNDVECEYEGCVPIGCPLIKVTLERVKAYDVR